MWKDYNDEQPEFDRQIVSVTRHFGLTIFVTITRLNNIDRDGHHYQGVSNPNWRPELWMYIPEIPKELLENAKP